MMARENFGSRIGAILATAGSAVGLGNIWRFPIETGKNGGAAFILIYIGCILLIGLPLMMSEFLIGRSTQSNTARAFQKLAPNTHWKWVGRLGVLTAFIIMCYYSVVAGWTLGYTGMATADIFSDKSPGGFKHLFDNFSQNPWIPVMCMVVFVLLTHFVIVRGVTKGIERSSKVMMPMLFIMIIILFVCAITLPNSSEGISFLLEPDFSKVDGNVLLNAMGQAFYSLSLGMGCLCTYASYFNKKTHLGKTAVQVSSIDTLIAIMAGFIIFPAFTSVGMNPNNGEIGPSLLFVTLPNVFQQAFGEIPLVAYLFSLLFYMLIVLAALTSTISLYEVITSYLSEEFKMSRKKATALETTAVIIIGVFCTLSFGPLKDVKLFDLNIFGIFDWISANLLMPIGGIGFALFTGWYLDRKLIREEITNYGMSRARYLHILIFILRFIVPISIVSIMIANFNA